MRLCTPIPSRKDGRCYFCKTLQECCVITWCEGFCFLEEGMMSLGVKRPDLLHVMCLTREKFLGYETGFFTVCIGTGSHWAAIRAKGSPVLEATDMVDSSVC